MPSQPLLPDSSVYGGGQSVRRWQEPPAWDLFESDGAFAGRVHFPSRSRPLYMRGHRAWGYVRDGDDVPYLIRWRITPVSDSRPR